jgi:outer membrane protein OmpA-like peptidoglycan-associated protein
MKKFFPLLILPFLAFFQVWAEQAWAEGDVQFYSTPPSAEELARQLAGGGAHHKKHKTRAIVFDAAPSTETTSNNSHQQNSYSQQQDSTPVEAGQILAFPIYFSLGSAQITPQAKPFIETVANLMHMNSTLRFMVEGHTDSIGNPQKNLELSRRRAQSVMEYLINKYNVDPSRLTPVGKGSQEPLKGLSPRDPTNRRVQFRTLG